MASANHSFRARRGTPVNSETCVQLAERIEASLRQMAARRQASTTPACQRRAGHGPCRREQAEAGLRD
ncbi:MAG: hypothetical protein OXD30_05660, partial [Bryobacterales bacterium]|nr:hypothetical protein [Bryobacterales bacterium]